MTRGAPQRSLSPTTLSLVCSGQITRSRLQKVWPGVSTGYDQINSIYGLINTQKDNFKERNMLGQCLGWDKDYKTIRL